MTHLSELISTSAFTTKLTRALRSNKMRGLARFQRAIDERQRDQEPHADQHRTAAHRHSSQAAMAAALIVVFLLTSVLLARAVCNPTVPPCAAGRHAVDTEDPSAFGLALRPPQCLP